MFFLLILAITIWHNFNLYIKKQNTSESLVLSTLCEGAQLQHFLHKPTLEVHTITYAPFPLP